VIAAGLTLLVADRLKDQVPTLRMIQETADLAALVAAGALPAQMPAAFVVWAGDRPKANDMDNIVRQEVTSTISVVLVGRKAGEATGAAAAATISAIGDQVVAAIVGWQPDDMPFEYAGGRLLGIQASAVFIQLDFAITWWLRQQ
jgi:hypothetical protein